MKEEKKTKKTAVKKETKKAPKKTEAKKEAKAEPKAAPKKVEAPEAEEKQKIINEFATHAGDTGSPEVQVAILTWKILKLQKHLEENIKDNHSRRGLLKIVSKRRRIMKYLKDKNEPRYSTLEKKIQQYQTA